MLSEANESTPHKKRIPLRGVFQGPWAILPDVLEVAVAEISRADSTQARLNTAIPIGAALPYKRLGRTALIEVLGPLQKYRTWMSWFLGDAIATELVGAVDRAAADPETDRVLLVWDCPGGQVAGTEALAEAVHRAKQSKPVVSFASDLMVSAAYWVASQSTRIIANPTALVGAIGTYATVADWSGFFEKSGVKMHVIRAGEFKGVGTMGTEITASQIKDFQRVIDAINREFLKGVARGRGLPMDRVRGLADGRVHLAADARSLGLIDHVGQLSDLLAELDAESAPKVRAMEADKQRQRRLAEVAADRIARAKAAGYHKSVRGRKIAMSADELEEAGIEF